MKQQVRALLLANSAVTALVGNRIDWKKNAQGAAYPRITLHGVGRTIGSHMQGPDAIQVSRVQINCVALTYAQGNAVGEAVLAALNHYRDSNFRLIEFAGDGDLEEDGTNEAERPLGVRLDFLIRWRP